MTIEARLGVLYAALEALDRDHELRERIESFFSRMVAPERGSIPHAGMTEDELLEVWMKADREIAEFNGLVLAARKLIQ
jgi:hypothetical protein